MRSGCPICGDEPAYIDFSTYPYEVCSDCDKKAVNEDGQKARSDPKGDWGDNPVYVDGEKCWRRYRFGGWVTMKDMHDCESLEEFYQKHGVDMLKGDSLNEPLVVVLWAVSHAELVYLYGVRIPFIRVSVGELQYRIYTPPLYLLVVRRVKSVPDIQFVLRHLRNEWVQYAC